MVISDKFVKKSSQELSLKVVPFLVLVKQRCATGTLDTSKDHPTKNYKNNTITNTNTNANQITNTLDHSPDRPSGSIASLKLCKMAPGQ